MFLKYFHKIHLQAEKLFYMIQCKQLELTYIPAKMNYFIQRAENCPNDDY